MSDHLESRDVQVGLEMAWHGKTIVVPVVTQQLAFPYEISREPVFNRHGVELPDQTYFVCSDDGLQAGKVMEDSYIAMNNARFWEVVNNALGGSGATIESAGTLYDRRRRFITVKLNSDMSAFNVGGRTFQNRVSLLDSIDGSTNFYAINTSICTVCANTFQMTLKDKSGEFQFKVRHTKKHVEGIEGVEKAIDSFVGVAAQFKHALEQANSIPLETPDARALFAGWVAKDAGLSSRAYNTVGRLTELFKSGAGNRGETLLDAFSAVTDFYSHESSGGIDEPGFRVKQNLSSEFGSGRNKKIDFFSNLFTVKEKEDPIFNAPQFKELVGNDRIVLTAADVLMTKN